MPDQVMIAFSSPKPGREDEFLAWYRDAHMPDVCAVDGIEHGTLYEIDEVSPTRTARYFSIYELSRTPQEVLGGMMQRREAGQMRDTEAMEPASGALMFCRKLFSS